MGSSPVPYAPRGRPLPPWAPPLHPHAPPVPRGAFPALGPSSVAPALGAPFPPPPAPQTAHFVAWEQQALQWVPPPLQRAPPVALAPTLQPRGQLRAPPVVMGPTPPPWVQPPPLPASPASPPRQAMPRVQWLQGPAVRVLRGGGQPRGLLPALPAPQGATLPLACPLQMPARCVRAGGTRILAGPRTARCAQRGGFFQAWGATAMPCACPAQLVKRAQRVPQPAPLPAPRGAMRTRSRLPASPALRGSGAGMGHSPARCVPRGRTAAPLLPPRPLPACPVLLEPFPPLRVPPRRQRAWCARRGRGAVRGRGGPACPAPRGPGPLPRAWLPPLLARHAHPAFLATPWVPRLPQTAPLVPQEPTTPPPVKRFWGAFPAPWGVPVARKAQWHSLPALPALPGPQHQTLGARNAWSVPQGPFLRSRGLKCARHAPWATTTAKRGAPPPRPAFPAQRALPPLARGQFFPSSASWCPALAHWGSSSPRLMLQLVHPLCALPLCAPLPTPHMHQRLPRWRRAEAVWAACLAPLAYPPLVLPASPETSALG